MATEEHPLPLSDAPEERVVRLVRAYPSPRAIPLPPLGTPVGREWLAGTGFEDARVSSRHVTFRRRGGTLSVEDADSRNGTFVDGQRLTPGESALLEDGSILRIGRSLFVLRESFRGADSPSAPIAGLVAPFGLRGLAEALSAFQRRPTRCVLVEGETGTGKEQTARAFAHAAGRRDPLPVNIAGVPAGVFESQLFGHVVGAFSGAGKGAPGLAAEADRGALFLDEIGELPLELQPKLLRLLDTGEVLPVGGKPRQVDVLFIAATNRSLAERVETGAFRRDLLARLGAFHVTLPPLRDRVEDVFAIAESLFARRGEQLAPEHVEVEAVERLLLEPYRANVRELEAVLHRIAAVDPPPHLRLRAVERVLGAAPRSGPSLSTAAVERALAEAAGNESEAARKLGISRGKLRRFRDRQGA